jgi:hypothetical protein
MMQTAPTPSDSAHVAALRLRHAQLERQVREEQKRPYVCGTELRHLKRQRLAMKEQLEAASQRR